MSDPQSLNHKSPITNSPFAPAKEGPLDLDALQALCDVLAEVSALVRKRYKMNEQAAPNEFHALEFYDKLDTVIAALPTALQELRAARERVKELESGELKDYKFLMDAATKVYCHITENAISKTNTMPDAVIRLADDIQERHIQEAIMDEREVWERQRDDFALRCIERAMREMKFVETKAHATGERITVSADLILIAMKAELAADDEYSIWSAKETPDERGAASRAMGGGLCRRYPR